MRDEKKEKKNSKIENRCPLKLERTFLWSSFLSQRKIVGQPFLKKFDVVRIYKGGGTLKEGGKAKGKG